MNEPKLPKGSLRARTWRRFLRGPDPSLLEELYVPALQEAIRYDRCCAYFSSTVLSAAARGFGKLIERLLEMGDNAPRPAVRLVVNEELSKEDVQHLTETGDVSVLEETLMKRLKNPTDVLERDRLKALAWLVQRGLLDIRVGVMRTGDGIVHAKFGIVTDETGDSIVFSGSGNESGQGLRANYERLDISTSWGDPDRFHEYHHEFENLWADKDVFVHTVTLPEALRLRLIKFAPKEPPIIEPSNALARQKAAMIWRFIIEAPFMADGASACDGTAFVDLWPHQKKVVYEVANAWPDGRLLCDEVGMGKTIEAILILRRLMAGRGVRRVLILLPKGLLKQWQAELREKGGLVFPRLEGVNTIVWPDERAEKVADLREALDNYDQLLMSRETARTANNAQHLLSATPWDLVVLDEAHAARRKEQLQESFNSATLLLSLLRQLQLRRRTRGFLLLSATPMQTHPWEPWDLLSVLGEGGFWLADFSGVRDYYDAIASLRLGRCDRKTARKATAMIAADPDFPIRDGHADNLRDADEMAKSISFASPSERIHIIDWLRKGSPLARRMHRNTRTTLRQYHDMGVLDHKPPVRDVKDVVFDFHVSAERKLYNAITQYIEHRYEELEREKRGKGFVMTVYRRRASSSPYAFQKSLERRRDGLLRIIEKRTPDQYLSEFDIPEDLTQDDLPDDMDDLPASGMPDSPERATAELNEVKHLLEGLTDLGSVDTKRDLFFDELRRITDDGRSALVFTEYKDTMQYLRNNLVAHFGVELGCYSGDGGQTWNGEQWETVSKDQITRALAKGDLRVLLCTDAASEGLNLQAAGGLVNYDLPWNPSKIEQRIGRIDRIGQKHSEVRVVNFFLRNSIDEKVYGALRDRCGLFEHFVGKMQPVLAVAKQILLGKEGDIGVISTAAAAIANDVMADEVYLDSSAEVTDDSEPMLTRDNLEQALEYFDGDMGVTVKPDHKRKRWIVSGPGISKTVVTTKRETLEHNPQIMPLSPAQDKLRRLVEGLAKPGERLPLIVASHQSDAFRSAVAYWADDQRPKLITSISHLRSLVDDWNGALPNPEAWLELSKKAQIEAELLVRQASQRAAKREEIGYERQREAARIRLKRELLRFLVSVGSGTGELNQILHVQLSRDTATSQRLKACVARLGGYPDWNEGDILEARRVAEELNDNVRMGRRTGRELEAALADPRWATGPGFEIAN